MNSVFRSLASRREIVSLLQRQDVATAWRRWFNESPLEWSYTCGSGTTPLLGMTVGQVVDWAAGMFGDRDAIVSVHQEVRKSFSEVKEECDLLAAGFLAVGLEPGDRLGICGHNSYEWYITQFAAAKAGLVLVNIDPAFRSHELEHCLKKTGVRGLVCGEKYKMTDYYKLLSKVAPELRSCKPGDLHSKSLPDLKKVFICSKEEHHGTFKFNDLFEAGESPHHQMVDELATKIQFDTPCSIQFTSGTTGLPKGSVLSHHMIVNNAYFTGKRIEYWRQPHRVCLAVPFHHCFGCVLGTMCAMIHGATSVVPCHGYDPDATVRVLESEAITSFYGTPTMFVDVLNAYKKYPSDLSYMVTGIMAGAPCPTQLFMDAMNILNMKELVVAYGMTETSPVTFQCFPSDSVALRSTTIGYPLDHVEAKVVDEEGDIVPVGEPGELFIRGYCNLLRYYDDPETTKEVLMDDRWMRTGDLAVIYSDGYAQIIGRLKEMVIRGGENIFPVEIETFLRTHPDIIEAQVVGVPDDRMGEELATWIQTTLGSELTEEDLREWCKEKIAHYKVPRYILFKEAFPMTTTGKIKKYKLREQAMEELHLTED